MTTTTTQRENLSGINGRVPEVDSPAVSARARARLTDTESNGNREVGASPRNWWAWTTRPASLRDTWANSAVDKTRIPAANPVLHGAWQVSNWTDRLIMFALIVLLPAALTGPLRWCATRPTRRYGLYLTLAALTGAYLLGRS
jgi:hypothetical protein